MNKRDVAFLLSGVGVGLITLFVVIGQVMKKMT